MAGRYKIIEKIGQGGLGDVYQATDTQLDRQVALKRIRETEDSDTNEDLFKEAKTLSSLQHPNIVTVFDIGRDEEGGFAVMELLKGETLDETIERGALTMTDFEQFVYQTCEGMIAAQTAGLLHRDLKPSNLMVIWLPSGKFQVKILDFGLAKFSQTPTEQTSDQEDGILGSIYFMAPEQFERAPLDMRTDMYSLGCVYYYALTQQHPFIGENAAQVMASHLRHDVRDLRLLRPDLPSEICIWVMWLINRKLENRPENAREALDHFKAAMGGGPAAVPGYAMPVAPTPQQLATAVPAAFAVPAVAPAGLVVGQRTAEMLRRQYKRSFIEAFPKWALVTLPILLTLTVGIVVWKAKDTTEKREDDKELRELGEGKKGNAGTVRKLIDRMKKDGLDAVSAAGLLTKLEGLGVDQEMVNQIPNVEGKARINLIRAIAIREYKGAVPKFLEMLGETEDGALRLDLIVALDQVATDRDIDKLISLYADVGDARERAALEESIVKFCGIRRDSTARAKPLLSGLRRGGSKEVKLGMITMLGRVGGEEALRVVKRYLSDPDEDFRLAAIEALGTSKTAAPAEDLFELASDGESKLTKSIALLSYIQLVESSGDVPVSQKVEMLTKALELAKTDSVYKAQKRVFSALSNLGDEKALALAEQYGSDEAMKTFAVAAKKKISRSLKKAVSLGEDGGSLPAIKASIRGDDAQYLSREEGGGVIGAWKNSSTSLAWTAKLSKEGTYRLIVNQAADESMGGRYQVTLGGETFTEKVIESEGEEDFKVVLLGEVEIAKPGSYLLYLNPINMTGQELMILRDIELKLIR